jgi:outer membrane protein
MLRAVPGLLVVLLAAPAFAQPAPPAPTTPTKVDPAQGADAATFDAEVAALVGQQGGLTAESAATRATKVSPAARRKLAEIAVANAQAEQASLARVPQVGVTAKYTRLSDLDPVMIAGFDLPVLLNNYSVVGQVAVPLSDYLLTFPKTNAAARAGTAAARASAQATELDIAAEARLAYYEWVRAKLQVLVGQRLVAQIEASLTQVRALADVQRLSRADLLRVEAQRAEAQQTLAALTTAAILREEQLRIAIGAEAGEQLAIGEDVRADLDGGAGGAVTGLIDEAGRTRLDVKAVDAGIRARELARDAEAANRYPRLSAFGQVEYSNPNPRIFPSEDKFDLTWAAGLQLTWSLNDTLITGARLDEQAAEVRALREDRKALLDGVRIQVVSATQAVALARSALASSAEGLAAAEESYRVRKELLAAERATAVEIVDAETQLTQARFAAIDARIDLRIALAQLRHATGQDVK